MKIEPYFIDTMSELQIEIISKLKQFMTNKTTIDLKEQSIDGMKNLGTGIITNIQIMQGNDTPYTGDG